MATIRQWWNAPCGWPCIASFAGVPGGNPVALAIISQATSATHDAKNRASAERRAVNRVASLTPTSRPSAPPAMKVHATGQSIKQFSSRNNTLASAANRVCYAVAAHRCCWRIGAARFRPVLPGPFSATAGTARPPPVDLGAHGRAPRAAAHRRPASAPGRTPERTRRPHG